MVELLTAYSIKDILIFLVMVALAFKGVYEFLKWLKQEVTLFVHSQEKTDSIEKNLNEMADRLTKLEEGFDLLRQSDICDFRSFLVQEYNKFYQIGSIDSYSRAALEDRFKIYVKEQGNSFAHQLMEEIRKLPIKDNNFKPPTE